MSEQPLTCAVCGSPLEPDDRFCRFCGATVGPAPTRADPDQATLPRTPVVAADTPPEPLAPETPSEWPATDDALWRSPEPERPAAEEVFVEAEEIVVEPGPVFGADPEPMYDAELSTPVASEPVYTAGPPPPGPALPFSPDPFAAPPPPAEPKSGNRIWWIVGGIVLFLILLCCCLAIGIGAIASADSAFQDELRGTAALVLGGW